jgi:hypothetical protein
MDKRNSPWHHCPRLFLSFGSQPTAAKLKSEILIYMNTTSAPPAAEQKDDKAEATQPAVLRPHEVPFRTNDENVAKLLDSILVSRKENLKGKLKSLGVYDLVSAETIEAMLAPGRVIALEFLNARAPYLGPICAGNIHGFFIERNPILKELFSEISGLDYAILLGLIAERRKQAHRRPDDYEGVATERASWDHAASAWPRLYELHATTS